MLAELIFTVGAVAFTLGLIPAMLNRNTVIPRGSSLLTAFFLSLYVYAFASIGQTYSAAAGASTALAWWFLFIFRAPGPILVHEDNHSR